MNKQIDKIEIKRRYDAYINEGSYEKAGKKLNMSSGAIKSAVYRYRGLCLCGKEINWEQSETRCSECIEKNKKRLKERRKKQGADGICQCCGKNPVAYGCRSYCVECSDKRKFGHEKRKKLKEGTGECFDCKEKAEPNSRYCAYHIQYHKENNRKSKLRNGFSGYRLEVLERDNYSCQCCGIKAEIKKEKGGVWLEIHHLYTREDKPSNLITLCNKCHKAVTPIYNSGNILKIFDFIKQYYPNNF